VLSIGTKIDDLGGLDDLELLFLQDLGTVPTTAKRMKIDP